MNFKQKGFTTITILLSLALMIPFAFSSWMKMTAAPTTYSEVTEVPTGDTAVVLGAAAYGNRLSTVLQDRMDTALELYRAGKVSKLLLTGAENEVQAMAGYAREREIPEEALILDPLGSNTGISIRNIKNEGQKLILVTQKFHLPRALHYARASGLNAVGMAADRHEYEKILAFKKREALAGIKAMLLSR